MNNLVISYHDDKKGNSTSHIVDLSFKDCDFLCPVFSEVTCSTLKGYGSTKEEAIINFTIRFITAISKLTTFRDNLFINIQNVVEVDSFGNEIKKGENNIKIIKEDVFE